MKGIQIPLLDFAKWVDFANWWSFINGGSLIKVVSLSSFYLLLVTSQLMLFDQQFPHILDLPVSQTQLLFFLVTVSSQG